ncbi:Protein transport protein S9 plasma membrane t-SNARE [Tulasnella sp. UAMH 9824]|nr:Protein transport protein S9 plasma membrane t-SNARE [Tulasnella sp. UAMH 9824]
MSWFRRKDAPQIPEPTPSLSQPNVLRRGDRDTSPNPPSYRTSNANTYNRSRDGDPYAADLKSGGYNNQPTSTYQTGQDRYARSAGVGDPYSRAGAGNLDADRNELFSGYNPERSAGQNRFANRPGESGSGRFGGWQDRTPQNQEEQDEDVEQIKADTRKLKDDSLQSTRNALRLAREAEETARLTLNKLGDQSEKIASTERHLDQSKANTARAEDRTSEIKQLNRSIFVPVITWDKEGKRKKQEMRDAERRTAEQEEREGALRDVRESQNRIGRAAGYGLEDDGWRGGSGRMRSAQQKEERNRYRFAESQEEEDEDDRIEDELDDNLNQLGDVSKRLHALAMAQGDELDSQNRRLDRLNNNAEKLDVRLGRATNNLRRL